MIINVHRKWEVVNIEKNIFLVNMLRVTPSPGKVPTADTLPLEKHVADTKLESTSLSADVFLTVCGRDLARAGLVSIKYNRNKCVVITNLPPFAMFVVVEAFVYASSILK